MLFFMALLSLLQPAAGIFMSAGEQAQGDQRLLRREINEDPPGDGSSLVVPGLGAMAEDASQTAATTMAALVMTTPMAINPLTDVATTPIALNPDAMTSTNATADEANTAQPTEAPPTAYPTAVPTAIPPTQTPTASPTAASYLFDEKVTKTTETKTKTKAVMDKTSEVQAKAVRKAADEHHAKQTKATNDAAAVKTKEAGEKNELKNKRLGVQNRFNQKRSHIQNGASEKRSKVHCGKRNWNPHVHYDRRYGWRGGWECARRRRGHHETADEKQDLRRINEEEKIALKPINWKEKVESEDVYHRISLEEAEARRERENKQRMDRYNKNQYDDTQAWVNVKQQTAANRAKDAAGNAERDAKALRTNAAMEASAAQSTSTAYADIKAREGLDQVSRAARKAGVLKVETEKTVAELKAQGTETLKKAQVAASETIAEAEKRAADLKAAALKLKGEKMQEVVEIQNAAKEEAAAIIDVARQEAAKTDAPTKAPTKYPTKFPTASPTSSPTLFPTNMPTSVPTLMKPHSVVILKNYILGLTYSALAKNLPVLQGVKYAVLTSVLDVFKSSFSESLLQAPGAPSDPPVEEPPVEQKPHVQVQISDAIEKGVGVRVTITPPTSMRTKDIYAKLKNNATMQMLVNAISEKITKVVGVGSVTDGALAVTVPTVEREGEPDDVDKDKVKMVTEPPTPRPTKSPTSSPTLSPTKSPTGTPTLIPTLVPTEIPTAYPTKIPTKTPTGVPTPCKAEEDEQPPGVPCTEAPFCKCSKEGKLFKGSGAAFCWLADDHSPQTCTLYTGKVIRQWTWVACTGPSGEALLKCPIAPTLAPTLKPSTAPTADPTEDPTASPTYGPSLSPTKAPTTGPTGTPTGTPTPAPTLMPTVWTPEGKECTLQQGVHFTGHIRDQYVGLKRTHIEGSTGDCYEGNKDIILPGGPMNFAEKCKDMCQQAQLCDKWSYWSEADTGGHCYFFIAAAPKRRGYHTWGGECHKKDTVVVTTASSVPSLEPTVGPTGSPTEDLEAKNLATKQEETARKAKEDNAVAVMKAQVAGKKAEAEAAIAEASKVKEDAEATAAKATAEADKNKAKATKVLSQPCPK
jgi:hypothetical protein